jgi:anti-sigma regulatory factor (Ser/Thr protein kinase)
MLISFEEYKSKKKQERQIKLAKKKKNRKRLQYSKKHMQKKERGYQANEIKTVRSRIRKEIFDQYHYNNTKETIKVDYELGLEDGAIFSHYYDFAERLVDSNSEDLCIDLTECKRIWPSAIVLLCSAMKWIELSCFVNKEQPPRISSKSPVDELVEGYLIHCGFYDYVRRSHPVDMRVYNGKEMVKIKRETKREHIIEREKEFNNLVKYYSILTGEQYELFICKIIPEILNNVVEHGITSHDQGWWMLGQYHKRHGLISICIADNGIGFKQNLISGPQKDEILNIIENKECNDGDFIKLAFEENVSGSYNAPQKTQGIIIKKYEHGARRGHGLKRILATCIICNIRLSVFSHYGFICYNEKGEIDRKGSSSHRLFAGTLYHLNIPARQEI